MGLSCSVRNKISAKVVETSFLNRTKVMPSPYNLMALVRLNSKDASLMTTRQTELESKGFNLLHEMAEEVTQEPVPRKIIKGVLLRRDNYAPKHTSVEAMAV